MAEKYMFFNSTPDDRRRHQASDMAEYWSAFLSTGLIHRDNKPLINIDLDPSVADAVVLTPGQAIVKGHYYGLTENLKLPVTSTGEGRRDRVVLRWDNNLENRYIRLFIKEGSKDHPPSLERSDKVYELSLFQILRKPGKAVIEYDDIIDERLNSSLCGIATSLVTIPTDVFLEDWDEFKKKYEKWFLEVQDETFLTVKEHRQSINELQRELAHMKMLQSASYRVKDGATFVTDFQDSTGVEIVTIPRVVLTQSANAGSYTIFVDKSSSITPGNYTLTSSSGSEVIQVKGKTGNALNLVNALTRSYPKDSEVSKTQMTIEPENQRATFGGFGLTQYRKYSNQKMFESEVYQFDGYQYIYYSKGTQIWRTDLFTLSNSLVTDLRNHSDYDSSAPLSFEGVVNGHFVIKRDGYRVTMSLYTMHGGIREVGSLEGSYDRVIIGPDNLEYVLVYTVGDYSGEDYRLVRLSSDPEISKIEEVTPIQEPVHNSNNALRYFHSFPQRDGSLFTVGEQGRSDYEYRTLNYWRKNDPLRRIAVEFSSKFYETIRYCPSTKRVYEIQVDRNGSLKIGRSDVINFDTSQTTITVNTDRSWWTVPGVDSEMSSLADVKILDQREPGVMLVLLRDGRFEVAQYLELNLNNRTVIRKESLTKNNYYEGASFMGLPVKYSGRNKGPSLYRDLSNNVYIDLDLTFGDGIGLLENDLYLRVKNSKNFATWVKTTSATMTEIQAGTITQKATYGRGEYQGIVSTLEPTNEVRLRFRRSSLTTAAQVNEIIGGVE